ncbi:BaiN/RdsA family NAD(P)/FAD-dependent oxidoreductase [Nafulsella turpanensis]|uniref:NAD(P)/FAD-dependent oxidoreductase n=1 Tax=Nafulsella turpanensis TaxID=1265690 RepID=UPI00058B82DC|nr:NAD(P)/FAD-dependent oxidoreductase [Nafulsella turpanensis]
MESVDLAVIGGGAAGFFAAIRAAEINPSAKIHILEKSGKLLSKVKISGGGRCNVTHDCSHVSQLIQQYPRGGNALKKMFGAFKVEDTVEWFARRGVELKVEKDGRMFPLTDNSQTIIDCFLQEAKRLRIQVHLHFPVNKVKAEEGAFLLYSSKDNVLRAKKVLVATGGHPKEEAYNWLRETGHSLSSPIPSLFTFNSPANPLRKLPGISVPKGLVRIEGTKLQYEGPVLITHWGFSGPAVLKLSAFGARWVHEQDYTFVIHIRWVAVTSEEELRAQLKAYQQAHPKRLVQGHPLFELPQRLWAYACEQAEIYPEKVWAEVSRKSFNKLLECLFRDRQEIKGKTTFKEEFVTCGGIPLSELHLPQMESRLSPGLFFAGEVLDVDGITGGFNFQHAWTSGWLAGSHIGRSLAEI